METVGSIILKPIMTAVIPFLLLAVGLATWQIWALAASCFSATMIGLFHAYKIVKMVRQDIREGRKPNPFKNRKKLKP